MVTPKWKRFENVVADLQRAVSVGATVAQNGRVRGKITGVLREIDISVRQQVAQFKIFVAIDCKDYGRPVDVKDVEAFAGLLEDVGANKGAMVAANGFTETAKTLAKAKGIDLYRLLESDHIEWSGYITVPALVRNLRFSFRAVFEGSRQDIDRADQGHDTILFASDGTPLGSVRELAMKMWKTAQIPEEPGEYERLAISDRPTYVTFDDRLVPIRVRIDARVSYEWYFGQLPLSAVRGFANETDGSFRMHEFTTEWLVFADVEKSWQRVPSPDELSVRPMITFLLKDAPPGDPDAHRSMRISMRTKPDDSTGK